MKTAPTSGFDWLFWGEVVGGIVLLLDKGLRLSVFGWINALADKIANLVHHQTPPPPPPPATPIA